MVYAVWSELLQPCWLCNRIFRSEVLDRMSLNKQAIQNWYQDNNNNNNG